MRPAREFLETVDNLINPKPNYFVINPGVNNTPTAGDQLADWARKSASERADALIKYGQEAGVLGQIGADVLLIFNSPFEAVEKIGRSFGQSMRFAYVMLATEGGTKPLSELDAKFADSAESAGNIMAGSAIFGNVKYAIKGAQAAGNNSRLANSFNSAGNVPNTPPARFKPTPDLKNHIRNFDPKVPRNRGIGGAHNSVEFFKNDIQVVSRTPHPTMKGVEVIRYRPPLLDKAGKPIPGQYRSKIREKTVYDPAIISDDEFVRRGIEAANDALSNSPDGTLPRVWNGVDSKGVPWTGNFENGNITTFFPE